MFGEVLNDEDMLAELDAIEAEDAAEQMGNLAPQRNIDKVEVEQ